MEARRYRPLEGVVVRAVTLRCAYAWRRGAGGKTFRVGGSYAPSSAAEGVLLGTRISRGTCWWLGAHHTTSLPRTTWKPLNERQLITRPLNRRLRVKQGRVFIKTSCPILFRSPLPSASCRPPCHLPSLWHHPDSSALTPHLTGEESSGPH